MRIERLGQMILVVVLFVAAFFAVVYTIVLFSLWAVGYVELSDRMLWPALAITVGAGPIFCLVRNAAGSCKEYPRQDDVRTFTTKFLAVLSATSHLPSGTQ